MNEYSAVYKTGYLTFLASYILFILADFWRPGFVSWVFSVHWLLLAAVIFGVLWAWSSEINETRQNRLLGILLKLSLGVILLIVLWREGGVFGDFRIILALIGFFLPWLLPALLSANSEAGKM